MNGRVCRGKGAREGSREGWQARRTSVSSSNANAAVASLFPLRGLGAAEICICMLSRSFASPRGMERAVYVAALPEDGIVEEGKGRKTRGEGGVLTGKEGRKERQTNVTARHGKMEYPELHYTCYMSTLTTYYLVTTWLLLAMSTTTPTYLPTYKY
ncbi:hypothetical protein IWZ01DRAFT_74605 [Phyllosticta capitalensis]